MDFLAAYNRHSRKELGAKKDWPLANIITVLNYRYGDGDTNFEVFLTNGIRELENILKRHLGTHMDFRNYIEAADIIYGNEMKFERSFWGDLNEAKEQQPRRHFLPRV